MLNHLHEPNRMGSRKLGVISSGAAASAREVLGDNASYLKLGMSHPFPDALARNFISQVEQVIVVEELDPSSNRQSAL